MKINVWEYTDIVVQRIDWWYSVDGFVPCIGDTIILDVNGKKSSFKVIDRFYNPAEADEITIYVQNGKR